MCRTTHRQQLEHCAGITAHGGSFLRPHRTAMPFTFPHLLGVGGSIHPKIRSVHQSMCRAAATATTSSTFTPQLLRGFRKAIHRGGTKAAESCFSCKRGRAQLAGCSHQCSEGGSSGGLMESGGSAWWVGDLPGSSWEQSFVLQRWEGIRLLEDCQWAAWRS